MKVEVLKENLKKVLSVCERITRKTTTLPVLQNVLIEAKDNFLELTTTNLEVSIQWGVLAKIKKQGRVLVPATFLSNLVSLIPTEKVEFHEDNKNLILTSKDQEAQVQGQDPEEFPIVPRADKEISLKIDTQALEQGLAKVVDIPSVSQIRPEISGVLFELKKGKLKLVSTDSFRLAEKVINLKTQPKDGKFILPQESSRELLNILSQQEGEIEIFPSMNQVVFELSDNQQRICLSSRLIEGEYPNYQEIIPKKSQTKSVFKKEEFSSQVKQAGLFSGKVQEVKLTFTPKEGKVKLFSQSAERGRNEAYLNCKIEGKAAEVSFNHRYLLEGLAIIPSSEVVLELSEQEGPGILKPVGDTSLLYVLMPIKAS